MSDSRSFDAKVFLSHVTTLPGVYQMRDKHGTLLYVGKAKNLKKRLASYFRETGLSVKTQALMALVVDIETTATENESAALILENNLIKAHRPRFNILMRDDKSYPYIKLSNHDFPRLAFHRGARRNGEFFGPYPNSGAVRQALDVLQKVFRVRQCEDSFFANRSRPCLQYQIERCHAPCVGYINEADYAQTVAQTRAFLSGRSDEVFAQMSAEMNAAAENLDFERAAQLRDQIALLRKVGGPQHQSHGAQDCDVLAVATGYGEACVQVVFYRDGDQVASQAYYPKIPEETAAGEILAAFIAQFYAERHPPPQLIVNAKPQEAEMLLPWLAERGGHKVVIQQNPRENKRQWLTLAEENARLNLNLTLSAKLSMQTRFAALAEAFGWEKVPERLECVDISHMQGDSTVASCVVFDRRGALKSDYRRFNIKDVAAGDDYAAIRQVVTRRFARLKETADAKWPDVMFIDGGKGQLRQAVEALAELGIANVQLVGVSKGQGRKAGLEQFWLPGKTTPFFLPADSQAMQLIVQIRDEAHRFAISAHRKSRDKKSRGSVLEQIPGVGAKRRQALLKYFGGLAMVEAASVQELSRVPGISLQLAEDIYASFHDRG
ncbi:MAG: excinuclease ABC subunit UvrC [Cardiobacteriaceae bacterium]|nr:excinuclease ABC subunit UvrC [Cardiobacteriaceae bacterium]